MTYYEKVIRINTEEIENINDKDTSMLDKPQIYGCFSIDKERNYIPGPQNMQYYCPRFKDRNLQLDLNSGINIVVRKPQNLNEKLDHLLKFILNNKNKFSHEDRLLDADFICYRGMLTKIMGSIDLREDWSLCVSKWKGSIYLCEVDKKVTYNIPQAEMDKFCSWGYKFEQYMLTDTPGKQPETSKPVYESEEFCCIFKSKIGSHKLLYGAEMDGVLSSIKIDMTNPQWNNLEFIELKTSKQILKANDERIMKQYKYIKWWTQCFLANIKQVHCGFRDQKGIVREIVPYQVKDLPKMSGTFWNWKNCLNFCNIFLNMVKNTIPEELDDPYTVWKFDWKPNGDFFKYEEIQGPSPSSFLPTWYIESMKSK